MGPASVDFGKMGFCSDIKDCYSYFSLSCQRNCLEERTRGCFGCMLADSDSRAAKMAAAV